MFSTNSATFFRTRASPWWRPQLLLTWITDSVTQPISGALSEALGKLIADPLEARRLGEEARRFALENCDLERMIARMEAIFQRVAH